MYARIVCLLAATIPLAASVLYTPNGTPRLWPGGIIYYTIDPAIPNPQRILDAIQMWTSQTPLQLLPRAAQSDYVQFVRASGPGATCESSALGMMGGVQSIELLDACSTGQVAHEIGHAFGLQHEQVRSDRNSFVTVLYENVDKRRYLNFELAPFNNRNFGYYDYDSIMHYGPKIFGVNDSDTIETVPVGVPLGQRAGLSAGDIDGISRAYGFKPTGTTITSIPAGLTVTVDGADIQTPHAFNWSPGSTHTVAAASQGQVPRYRYLRWTDSGDASHTVTASADVTVFAAVFQEFHQLTVETAGSGTTSNVDGLYAARLPVKLSQTPASGSTFVAWTSTNDLAANAESISTPSPVTEVLNSTTHYTANFTSSAVTTIDSKPSGRRVTVDGTVYLTPVNFAWQSGSTHTLDANAAQTDTTGTAQYVFTSWEDSGKSAARTITAGTNAIASYSTAYLLTFDTAGSGTVSALPPSPDGYYPAGTTVRLTAQPASGSFLRYWLGDANGGDITVSLTMDRQRQATAFFNTVSGILVTSALSYRSNPLFNFTGASVATSELVSVFGPNIGPAAQTSGTVDASGKLTTTLAGVQVTFDGTAAPLVYAAPNQINAIVPPGVTPGVNTIVRVLKNGNPVGSLGVGVSITAPALASLDASGTGQAAALNQDFSVNSAANPAPHASVITLYGTGAGQWSTSIPSGQVTGSTLVAPVAPVQVRIGKLPAKVLYAGTAPGLVEGVLQVNVQLPDELIGGPAIPVQVIMGDYASMPGVTIAVQ